MNLLKHILGNVVGLTVETRKGHPVTITDSKVENNRVYVKANDQWMRAGNLTISDGTQVGVVNSPQVMTRYEFKFKPGAVITHKQKDPYQTIEKCVIDANNPYLGYYTFQGVNELFYAPRVEEFYEEDVR